MITNAGTLVDKEISLILRVIMLFFALVFFHYAHASLSKLQDSLPAALIVDEVKDDSVTDFINGLSGIDVTVIKSSSTITKDFECFKYSKVFMFGVKIADESVLNCGVSRVVVMDTQEAIANLRAKLGKDFGYVYTDQPIKNHLKVISENIPAIKTVGILYSNMDVVDEFKSASKELNLELVAVKIPDGDSAGRHFRRLLGQVDAILVTSNPVIWPPSDIKGYLLASVRQGKLIIGGSSSDNVKSGVFAGAFTDYLALGQHIRKKLSFLPCAEIKIASAPYFFKFNSFLAKRLGIDVRSESSEENY